MRTRWDDFDEIWMVDFEFQCPPGERPTPWCLVAKELRSGQLLRRWYTEFGAAPPYRIDDKSLVVAYYASAEWGCHLSLGWRLPYYALDLFAEYRNCTNGRSLPYGNGLLGALMTFGLPSIDVQEKEDMRDLAIRGAPFTEQEKRDLLAYCQTDVEALAQLLPRMVPVISVPHALLRGRYTRAAALIEHTGVPLDVEAWQTIRHYWEPLKHHMIREIDAQYGVYEGATFKVDKFKRYLSRNQMGWRYTETGQLDLQDDTFKDMARLYPQLNALRELRHFLGRLRLDKLAIGRDGRNRTLLSMFRAITGRNQPSTSKFIFGPSTWIRGLIRPQPGYGVAYIDWSQQEFAIAAVLSGDVTMRESYRSGDPYLAFGVQAGHIPHGATKQTHKAQRELCKRCVLAVQYGMGAQSLAYDIQRPLWVAQELLDLHRQTYRTFWNWNDRTVAYAAMEQKLWTKFGWYVFVTDQTKERTLRNFPMQAHGAEMLRLACCYATEQGIRVCAPVHDAILIEAPLAQLDEAILRTQASMAEASRQVLDGFVLRTDAVVVRYPERYMDERGVEFWDKLWRVIGQREATAPRREEAEV